MDKRGVIKKEYDKKGDMRGNNRNRYKPIRITNRGEQLHHWIYFNVGSWICYRLYYWGWKRLLKWRWFKNVLHSRSWNSPLKKRSRIAVVHFIPADFSVGIGSYLIHPVNKVRSQVNGSDFWREFSLLLFHFTILCKNNKHILRSWGDNTGLCICRI